MSIQADWRSDLHPRDRRGRFKEIHNPEIEGRLFLVDLNQTPDDWFPDLDDWKPDSTLPTPQAPNLPNVVAAAEAIRAGASTSQAVAAALDVHPREGNYLANAAAYLRLARTERRIGELATYSPTSLMHTLADLDDDQAASFVSQMVQQDPDVLTVDRYGRDALEQLLTESGLTAPVAARRAASTDTWLMWSQDRTGLAAAIGRARLSLVADRVSRAARAADEQVRTSPHHVVADAPGPVCGTCFMEMPRTGVCDTCG